MLCGFVRCGVVWDSMVYGMLWCDVMWWYDVVLYQP